MVDNTLHGKTFFSLGIIPIVLERLYDMLFMCLLHFMSSFIIMPKKSWFKIVI